MITETSNEDLLQELKDLRKGFNHSLDHISQRLNFIDQRFNGLDGRLDKMESQKEDSISLKFTNHAGLKLKILGLITILTGAYSYMRGWITWI